MPRFPQTLTLLCALLTFTSVAHAKDDGHDKDRAILLADYAEYDAASQNKDADGCVAFCTYDYTVVSAAGTTLCRSKTEAISLWKQIFAHAERVTSHTVVQSIQFTKEGASVTIKNDSTIVTTEHGVRHNFGDKASFQNDWIKSGNTWKMKHSIATSDAPTFDGKRIESIRTSGVALAPHPKVHGSR